MMKDEHEENTYKKMVDYSFSTSEINSNDTANMVSAYIQHFSIEIAI